MAGLVPAICGMAAAGGDGRDCPHSHQDKDWQEQHTPPPLAGGGWGEGWHQHRSRAPHTHKVGLRGASPLPPTSSRKGGGGLFSRGTIILMRMGTGPAMTIAERPLRHL